MWWLCCNMQRCEIICKDHSFLSISDNAFFKIISNFLYHVFFDQFNITVQFYIVSHHQIARFVQ
jgi:hypothetical protein